tara:strand:- start:7224 stop:7565 length:342 start_codon:yes stop_codon:yes gene_type:complete
MSNNAHRLAGFIEPLTVERVNTLKYAEQLRARLLEKYLVRRMEIIENHRLSATSIVGIIPSHSLVGFEHVSVFSATKRGAGNESGVTRRRGPGELWVAATGDMQEACSYHHHD